MNDSPILIAGGGIGGAAAQTIAGFRGDRCRYSARPKCLQDVPKTRPDGGHRCDGEIVTRVPLNDDAFRAQFPFP
jgi:hypothetical protein